MRKSVILHKKTTAKVVSCFVEYSGLVITVPLWLRTLTSTLLFILSIKLCRSPLALLSKPKVNWLLHALAR